MQNKYKTDRSCAAGRLLPAPPRTTYLLCICFLFYLYLCCIYVAYFVQAYFVVRLILYLSICSDVPAGLAASARPAGPPSRAAGAKCDDYIHNHGSLKQSAKLFFFQYDFLLFLTIFNYFQFVQHYFRLFLIIS